MISQESKNAASYSTAKKSQVPFRLGKGGGKRKKGKRGRGGKKKKKEKEERRKGKSERSHHSGF